jgi:FlaA1/EpsC-like NDP-sugar epimerase
MKPIHKLRRLWILLAFPVSFALTALAAHMNGFAEWYAGTVYPAISLAINHMTSHAQFSVGEIFVYFLVILLIISIVRLIVRIILRKGRRSYTAGKFFVNILCAASVLLMLFTVDCGINYYRVPFSQSCGLTVKPSKESELVQL